MCSLRLSDIPQLARLPIHVEGCDILPRSTAGELQRWYALKTSSGSHWHREVLRIIGWLNKPDFSRAELLQFKPWLEGKFPQAKTPGQTLTCVLRELGQAGMIEPGSRGEYRLTTATYR